jgi:hypothetical protein
METPPDTALVSPTVAPIQPSPLRIVIKQTIRVTVITALVGGLLFGAGFTPIANVEPAPWAAESAVARVIYSFCTFFLSGLYVGAIIGAISGLISGGIRAWRVRQALLATAGQANPLSPGQQQKSATPTTAEQEPSQE